MIVILILLGLYVLLAILLYFTRKRNINHNVHEIIKEELDGKNNRNDS